MMCEVCLGCLLNGWVMGEWVDKGMNEFTLKGKQLV